MAPIHLLRQAPVVHSTLNNQFGKTEITSYWMNSEQLVVKLPV